MAKKIDLSRVKEFLFNHGEKVALGTCAFLGVVLGLWGLMSAVGAGRYPGTSKSYAEVFKDRTSTVRRGLDQQVAAVDEKDAPAPQKIAGIDWPYFKSTHQQTPLVAIPDVNNDKRQRPKVLAIKNEPDSMKVDYLRGLVYLYDYGPAVRTNERAIKGLETPGAAAGGGAGGVGGGGAVPPVFGKKGGPMPMPMPMPGGGAGGGAGAASLPFARVGKPVRMVVVHARFPMKQQMVEFQKALRMGGQEEMLQKNRDDLPKPLGLDIIRVEILPGDKVKSEVLVGFVDVFDNKITETKKFNVNKKLEEVMRHAMYDERSPEMMKEYIWAGLTMPMPKLGNRQYPKFEMPGFKLEWAFMEEDEKRPNMAGGPGMPKEMMSPPGGGKGREPPGGGSGLPGFGGKRPFDKKAGTMPESEPKEPALEYALKDMTEKDLADSHPGLITRVFGGKEKRVEKDLNLFHVLGQHYPTEDAAANPNAANPNPQFPREGFAPPGAPGGMANQDLYFHAWDQQEGGQGAGFGVGPVPGGPGGPPRKYPMNTPKYPMPPPKGNEKPMGPGYGPGGVAAEHMQPWDRDALVRFIDVDVKPGKTYKYWIRVRMANPNFNKTTKEVAYQELTIHPELPPSEWVETEAIPIPDEYNLYAVDQQMLDDWDAGVHPKKGVSPVLKASEILNATPFQIHQWIEDKTDFESTVKLVIGDWVISERRMIHKGEAIGPKITVQAPVWFEKKDIFEVPQPPKAIGKKDKGASNLRGVHIDMLPTGGKAPVLVDFAGGKRLTPQNTLLEETAVDALVLFPDGSLKVLNSRDASDPTRPNSTAKDRIDRLTRVRTRIQEVLNSGDTGNTGPNLPGQKDRPMGSFPGKGGP